MENKVCYVVTVSERFPKNSYSAGLETDFKELILTGNKIHTLRSNALLWGKRLDKIAHNEAHLSLRTWAGKPYHTP